MKSLTFGLILALVTFVSQTGKGSASNPREADTRELERLEGSRGCDYRLAPIYS
jgi:hypothetical protein